MSASSDIEKRILITAPTGRDGSLVAEALTQSGMSALTCPTPEVLCKELDAGAGAIILAEEAISPQMQRCLGDKLHAQLPWSDIPIVVLASPLDSRASIHRLEQAISVLGNVTFVERPLRVATLITTMRAALRARARQYGARETLAELQVQEEEARRRMEFQQQLVGIVSHDLRNPIAAITIAAAGLLRRPDTPAHVVTAMTRVSASTDRATRLIRDLLDFTQARLGGGIQIRREEADLHKLTEQVLEEVRAVYPEREILHSSVGEGRGLCDPGRVGQMVANLVTNAITYSPADTPVKVETRGDGDWLTLEVHNQGAPIPAATLPVVFEPFERGKGSVKPAGSIGLGLFIVGALTRAHGGTTAVSSTAEDGTRFRIRLPQSPA